MLELLKVLLVFLDGSLLTVLEPGADFLDLGLDRSSVGSRKLGGNLLLSELISEGIGSTLEVVLSSDSSGLLLIFLLVLLGLSQHALDFLLGETALVVGDDNLVGLAGALLKSRDVHDSIGIKIEGNLNLWNTTWSGWDTGKLELAEQVVVLGASTFTLEDLDEHTRLVVGEGGEDFGLLGWDSSVSGNELGHLATSSLDTERQWGNIEEQDLVGGLGAGITREDSSLDSSTVGNSLVGVDRLVGLLAVEEIGDELLDSWDTGRATDEDNLVDAGLVDLSILQDTLDWLESGSEEVLAKFLESGTGDGSVEVNTLIEGVDLDGGLSSRRESTLGTLASSSETTESTCARGDILLVLALELVDEVVDETVVEVLTSQVGITSSGLDFEDTFFDGKEGNIESSTTKIEDEDVSLTLNLLVETVSNSSRGGLVDDSENVQTSDQASILGGLSLGVVEVGWDGDDGVVNGTTKVGLSSLTHLYQDHGRDLFWSELLGLTLELDLNEGLSSLVNNLEWEVLHIGLDFRVVELAANQSLGIEDSVCCVHGDLILSSITDQTLRIGEGNERGRRSVTLVVGDNFDSVISKDTYTGVGRSKINTYRDVRTGLRG